MERQNKEIHISTDDARGGSTPRVVRNVLGYGLLVAILSMSAIWISGALAA